MSDIKIDIVMEFHQTHAENLAHHVRLLPNAILQTHVQYSISYMCLWLGCLRSHFLLYAIIFNSVSFEQEWFFRAHLPATLYPYGLIGLWTHIEYLKRATRHKFGANTWRAMEKRIREWYCNFIKKRGNFSTFHADARNPEIYNHYWTRTWIGW